MKLFDFPVKINIFAYCYRILGRLRQTCQTLLYIRGGKRGDLEWNDCLVGTLEFSKQIVFGGNNIYILSKQ